MSVPFLAAPGDSSGSPMGRLHAAFGISSPANAADAHATRKEHTTACSHNFLVKTPPDQAGSQMSLALVSSRAPSAPNSRPTPEPLTPPNGARGSERTKSLMKTAPASICEATALARAGSLLHTAAPRPHSVS